MPNKISLAAVSRARQLPKWSQLREVVQFSKPAFGRTARRLENARTIGELRAAARRTTPRAVFDYVDGSAEEEITAARNIAAFRRVTLRPEPLRPVTDPDTAVELAGERSALPLVFAPTGYTRMMHHHGEAAVARVAEHFGVPYSLSTMATTSVADVREAAPGVALWFQLYYTQDAELNELLISRAEAAGCSTLLLTVDTSVPGKRLKDVANGLTIPPALTARTFLNMSMFPAWWLHKLTTPGIGFACLDGVRGNYTSEDLARTLFDPGLDFAALERLRQRWPGRLIVKGINTAEAAREVVRRGADGVVVSNHGGRQLDRSAATLEVLPAVRAAVGERATVLIDGGVRHGADIAVARALGADAAMIGRAYLYGIMAGGQDGVVRAYELLAEEYQRCMQLLGVRRSADLAARHVALPENGRDDR